MTDLGNIGAIVSLMYRGAQAAGSGCQPLLAVRIYRQEPVLAVIAWSPKRGLAPVQIP